MSKKNGLDTSELYPAYPKIGSLYLVAILTIAAVTLSMLSDCSRQEAPTPAAAIQLDRTYEGFFDKHGSPYPAIMSHAVAQTKRPALMAAIAVKESNGNPNAIGDNGDSHGAFQVQPKHWGEVPADPVQQALQAERILEELMGDDRRGSLLSGLARYNGGTKPPIRSIRYAEHVIKLRKGVLR